MEQIYIGDINIIIKINRKLLNFVKKYDVIDADNLVACEYILAKKDVILIKINDFYFIDIDSIKNFNELNNIQHYIEENIESNLLLKEENNIYDTFIGQLFVSNVKQLTNKNEYRKILK